MLRKVLKKQGINLEEELGMSIGRGVHSWSPSPISLFVPILGACHREYFSPVSIPRLVQLVQTQTLTSLLSTPIFHSLQSPLDWIESNQSHLDVASAMEGVWYLFLHPLLLSRICRKSIKGFNLIEWQIWSLYLRLQLLICKGIYFKFLLLI